MKIDPAELGKIHTEVQKFLERLVEGTWRVESYNVASWSPLTQGRAIRINMSSGSIHMCIEGRL